MSNSGCLMSLGGVVSDDDDDEEFTSGRHLLAAIVEDRMTGSLLGQSHFK